MQVMRTKGQIITIHINNKETETNAQTLEVLATELALPQRGVAMALDGQMIQRAEWGNTALHDGVNVLIIKAACGG